MTTWASACKASARSAARLASIARRRACAATVVTIAAITSNSVAAQMSEGLDIRNEKRGSVKKKSKASTPAATAASEGPHPNATPAITTGRTKIRVRFGAAIRVSTTKASRVAAPTINRQTR